MTKGVVLSSDAMGGLQVIVGIALSVIPLVVLIWVLLQLRGIAVDAAIARRQMQEIARHMGAAIVTERGVRRPVSKGEIHH